MGGFIVGAVVVAVLTIAWLSRGSSKVQKDVSREGFLKKLEQVTSSPRQLMPGLINSYQISFRSDERDVVYEDIEEKGFEKVDHKGYIKIKTQTLFTLMFNEKKGAAIIATSDTDSSKSSRGTTMGVTNIPAVLKNFSIITNNVNLTNRMFRDPRIVRILESYVNEDFRGSKLCALRIQEGIVALEVYSSPAYQPNIPTMKDDIGQFESNVNRLMVLADKIEKNKDDIGE